MAAAGAEDSPEGKPSTSEPTAGPPHCIRLRGPWRYRPLSRLLTHDDDGTQPEQSLPSEGRVHMPSDWTETLGPFHGRVQYLRSFGCPTSLTERHRVVLVFDQVRDQARAAINGTALGEFQRNDCPMSFEITELLQRRNELIVDVEWPGDVSHHTDDPATAGGLTGEVRLEIYEDR